MSNYFDHFLALRDINGSYLRQGVSVYGTTTGIYTVASLNSVSRPTDPRGLWAEEWLRTRQ